MSSYISRKLSSLDRIFSPTITAFCPNIPFTFRWRLLLLQPITILAALLTSPHWLFNNSYSVISIPTRSGKQTCLVYQPPSASPTEPNDPATFKPLHIHIHGGGWIGGFPEQDSRWCRMLARRTGSVVVSLSYRIAPRYVYPAAHEDVDDMVAWLVEHAELLGADARLVTIGGSSVGATLGLSACQYLRRRAVQDDGHGRTVIPLAFLGVCPALDYRQKVIDKPRPLGYPAMDPLAFLLPLFDVYAGTRRAECIEDARVHPVLMPREAIPQDVLIVAAGIDVLLHEALVFVERAKETGDRRVDCMIVDKAFHGFVESPSFVLEKERLEVFDRAVGVLRGIHNRAGYVMDKT